MSTKKRDYRNPVARHRASEAGGQGTTLRHKFNKAVVVPDKKRLAWEDVGDELYEEGIEEYLNMEKDENDDAER